ncbi:hypothetical protein ACI1US_02075 [Leucobacter sp. BZR 635]
MGHDSVSAGSEEAVGVAGRNHDDGDLFEVLHELRIIGECEVAHELEARLTGRFLVAVLGARHHGGVRLIEVGARSGLVRSDTDEVQVTAERRLAEHVEFDAISRVREGVEERKLLLSRRPRLAVNLATRLKAGRGDGVGAGVGSGNLHVGVLSSLIEDVRDHRARLLRQAHLVAVGGLIDDNVVARELLADRLVFRTRQRVAGGSRVEGCERLAAGQRSHAVVRVAVGNDAADEQRSAILPCLDLVVLVLLRHRRDALNVLGVVAEHILHRGGLHAHAILVVEEVLV